MAKADKLASVNETLLTFGPDCVPPPSPFKASARKALMTRGGYACEFVVKPPDLLQTDCSICLDILREPHLISCCGNNFCGGCILPVLKGKRPCPLCSAADFTVLHNLGHQRALNQLKVTCSHLHDGCAWTDDLGKLNAHLNATPSDFDERLDGCPYVVLACSHGCGGNFKRSDVSLHEDEQCPQRPYTCDYCREYESIQADVVFRHWPVCGHYPLSCPNRCTVYAFERRTLAQHLDADCPLKEVECDLHYAGCAAKLLRKDMPRHLADNHIFHTSLLASMNQKLADELSDRDDQISRLREDTKASIEELRSESQQRLEEVASENALLRIVVMKLEEDMRTLKEQFSSEISQVRALESRQEIDSKKEDASLHEEITTLQRTLSETKLSLSRQCHSVQAFVGLFPVEFMMAGFQHNQACTSDWQSPPFYSHLQGYKMCVVVTALGHNAAKGTHMSVYACLMRGEFDGRLAWPFRGEITVQLLNQLGDRNHATGTIRFNQWTPEPYCCRVLEADRAVKGWGIQKYIALSDLSFNEAKKRQYLLDDRLLFRVTQVKLAGHPPDPDL